MPTWGWYVIGAGIFVLVYLYIQHSNNQPAQLGATVVVPNTQDLVNYNGSADALAQILGAQQPLINHLAAGTKPNASGA